MNPIFQTYRPPGFHTVNAYLFIAEPEALIAFLKTVFYATEINRSMNPTDGTVGNCILQIGDASIMISQASGQFEGMRTSLYLFVADVDEIFDRAVANGAEVVFAPTDMDYDDRQGGIVDPAGNYWWITKRLEEKGYHE